MTQRAIILDSHDPFVQVLFSDLKSHDIECVGVFDKFSHAREFLGWQDVHYVYVDVDDISKKQFKELERICRKMGAKMFLSTNRPDIDEHYQHSVHLKSSNFPDEWFPKVHKTRKRKGVLL